MRVFRPTNAMLLAVCLMLSAIQTQAQSFAKLQTFAKCTTPNKLAVGRDGYLYGTTVSGGPNDKGYAYKIAPDGTGYKLLHNFGATDPADATHPSALVLGRDGNFYGTSFQGGTANFGAIFRMSPKGIVTVLHSFYDGSVKNDGLWITGSLMLAKDGSFYGVSYGSSLIFRITTSGSYSIIARYYSKLNPGISDIHDTLVQDNTGAIYGSAGMFGSYAIFKVDPSGKCIEIYNSNTDGALPGLTASSHPAFVILDLGDIASNNGASFDPITHENVKTMVNIATNFTTTLIRGRDGTLYFIKGYVIFSKYTADGNADVLHRWDFSTQQAEGYQADSLIQGADGAFYGVTTYGGANDDGVIYRLSQSGEYTVLHTNNDPLSDFYQPTRPQRGPDGNFYLAESKRILKITPSGETSVLINFNNNRSFGYGYPSIVQVNNNGIYCAVTMGGEYGKGSLFKISYTGELTSILSFGKDDDTNIQGLTVSSDSTIFVSTTLNKIYKITPDGVKTDLHQFTSDIGEAYNTHILAAGPDNTLYGFTNSVQGNLYKGLAFSISPSGVFTYIHHYGDGTVANEGVDLAGVMIAANGNIYGITQTGGEYNHGTVYTMTPSGTVTLLHSITVSEDCLNGIHQGVDGNIYLYNSKNIYKMTPDGGTYMQLYKLPTLPDSYFDNGPYLNSICTYLDGNIFALCSYSTLDSRIRLPNGAGYRLYRLSFKDKVKTMWVDANNRLMLMDYDAQTQKATRRINGPYPGWAPTSIAVRPDGNTSVLWTHTSGIVTLWNLEPSGVYTRKNYTQASQWHALQVAVGGDNKPYLMWRNDNGMVRIWKFDGSAPSGYSQLQCGPIASDVTIKLTAGFDNVIHLICSNGDIYNVDTLTGSSSVFNKSPLASLIDASENADGSLRLLWSSGSDYPFWLLNTTTKDYISTLLNKNAGWTPISVVSSASKDHILWFNSTTGTASLWNMDAAGNCAGVKDFTGLSGWTPVMMSSMQ